MRCSPRMLAGLAFVLASVACESGRRSSAGFRLPADGDPERGKATFVAQGCHTCHRVSGMDLPAPSVEPPVPVVLGGEVTAEPADGYLVTSIINPSFQLAHYPKYMITAGDGQSRMSVYADKMSVRQLTDLVAFLQSRYVVLPPHPSYYVH